MKALRFTFAATLGLIALAPAGSQPVTVGGVLSPPIPGFGNGSLYPTPIPPQTGMRGAGGGHRRGFGTGGFFFYDQPYVVHDVVVVHDQPAAEPVAAEPPSPPREPYVLGRTYASLPGSCLKMIEGGASYYYCGGDWYRQVGRQYKAVEMP